MEQQTVSKSIYVLLCTVPNEETGLRIAKQLVSESRIACAKIVPGIRSIYRWKGEICDDTEMLLLLKTLHSRVREVADRVVELHPYETPELIALPVVGGLPKYLDWLFASVGEAARSCDFMNCFVR